MLDHSVMWRAWLSQHVLPPLTVAIDIRLPELLPATISELCERLGCGERVLRADAHRAGAEIVQRAGARAGAAHGVQHQQQRQHGEPEAGVLDAGEAVWAVGSRADAALEPLHSFFKGVQEGRR